MKFIKTCFICILILLTGSNLLVARDYTNITVVPFINNGNIQYEKLSDYIPSYIILLLKDHHGYRVKQLLRVKQFMMEKDINLYDLKNQQILKQLALELKSDYIIGGFISEENNQLFLSCNIYTVTDEGMSLDNRIFPVKLDHTDILTINEAFSGLPDVFKDIFTIDPDPGFLTATADKECSLYVDGYFSGKTPIQVPVAAGEHSITMTYTSAGKEETVYTKTIVVEKESYIPIAVTVFRRLSINAGEKCTVFIDGKEEGTTLFEKDLYSGREYHVKVLYYGSGNTIIEVYNDIISTHDEIKPLYFPEKVSLTIDSPPPFQVDVAGKGRAALPATFEELIPGPTRVKIILQNKDSDREWVFYNSTVDLIPFSDTSLALGTFGYQKEMALAFIPSAAQFHNREPGKGWIILSSIIVSGITAGISAWQWIYWNGEYNRLLDDRNPAPPGWREDITNAEYYRKLFTGLCLGGCVLFAGIYSYSLVDGISTMNEINDLLYAETSY